MNIKKKKIDQMVQVCLAEFKLNQERMPVNRAIRLLVKQINAIKSLVSGTSSEAILIRIKLEQLKDRKIDDFFKNGNKITGSCLYETKFSATQMHNFYQKMKSLEEAHEKV